MVEDELFDRLLFPFCEQPALSLALFSVGLNRLPQGSNLHQRIGLRSSKAQSKQRKAIIDFELDRQGRTGGAVIVAQRRSIA
jgi:hypothetical protein